MVSETVARVSHWSPIFTLVVFVFTSVYRLFDDIRPSEANGAFFVTPRCGCNFPDENPAPVLRVIPVGEVSG